MTHHERWEPNSWDDQGRPHREMVGKPHPMDSGMDLLPEVDRTTLEKWLADRRAWAWTFATSMPGSPHFYVVKSSTISKHKYMEAYALIAAYGEDDTFNGQTRVYLYNEDRTVRWWVMSDYPARSKILNMAFLDDQPGGEWA